jgi:adenosylmethionine-8-amino-7-oxononanoate aminotransferase
MVTAIELEGYSPEQRIGLKIYEYALTQGVLLRPLGQVIYFMPPYIISYEEIDKMIEVAYEGIVKVLKKD